MKFYIILLFGILVSCGASTNQNVIKIACAANMQSAMDSIAVLFENEHGISCEITYGSSGMLTSQIENGAPYDVFISANMNYPKTIYRNGNGQKPVIYANGRLVFVMGKNTNYISIKDALINDEMRRIGIANEDTAPYGTAAFQYLKNSEMLTKIDDKLVIGESIGQVNQYITTEAVDGAFTSYSFMVKNKNNYKYFEVSSDLFKPINQGTMILNHGLDHSSDESNKFINFFSSSKCQDVLKYFGYLVD